MATNIPRSVSLLLYLLGIFLFISSISIFFVTSPYSSLHDNNDNHNARLRQADLRLFGDHEVEFPPVTSPSGAAIQNSRLGNVWRNAKTLDGKGNGQGKGRTNNSETNNENEGRASNDSVETDNNVKTDGVSMSGLINDMKVLTAPDPSEVMMGKMGNETLRKALGHSTWHFLHTMAGKYPTSPTEEQQGIIKSFIYLFARLYPCGDCAKHFSLILKQYPPDVSNRDALSQYFCKAHNKVNLRLGYEIFDCSLVGDRWKCGCADDDDADDNNEQTQEQKRKQDLTSDISTLPPSSSSNQNSSLSSTSDYVSSMMKMEARSMFPDDFEKLLTIKRKEYADTGKLTGVSGVNHHHQDTPEKKQ